MIRETERTQEDIVSDTAENKIRFEDKGRAQRKLVQKLEEDEASLDIEQSSSWRFAQRLRRQLNDHL